MSFLCCSRSHHRDASDRIRPGGVNVFRCARAARRALRRRSFARRLRSRRPGSQSSGGSGSSLSARSSNGHVSTCGFVAFQIWSLSASARAPAARRLRFRRPPRPGFALPVVAVVARDLNRASAQSGPHVGGGSACKAHRIRYRRARRPRCRTVIIGNLRVYCVERRGLMFGIECAGAGRPRAGDGRDRYVEAELGGGSASGTNGYGRPIPSRVRSGDGVPCGSVLSHRRVASSSGVAGRGADGGRVRAEEGELPGVDRYDAHARSRTARCPTVSARRCLRFSSAPARLAYRSDSWVMPTAHAARDTARQNHSRAPAVARSNELGVDLGRRDRRVTSRDVTERDRTLPSQSRSAHHATSATTPRVHFM